MFQVLQKRLPQPHKKKNIYLISWGIINESSNSLTSLDTDNSKLGEIGRVTEIWTHICSYHNFPPPFFCTDSFDTILLLIVCALRWYVKFLYRHLLVEDTFKNASVTQNIAPPKLQHV